jgi:hypothetical protein
MSGWTKWVWLTLWLGAAGTALAAEVKGTGAAGLAWLEGRWAGVQDGVESEEHWTSPAGGGLVGMHKDVQAGRMVGFEFFRIAPDQDGVLCYFTSPGGRPATPFRAVEQGASRVVFENREHDFPQRILYWLDDRGRLHARIEGTLEGKEQSEDWTWTRRGRR